MTVKQTSTFEPDGAPDRNRLTEPNSHTLNLKSVAKRVKGCRSVSTVPHFVPHIAVPLKRAMTVYLGGE